VKFKIWLRGPADDPRVELIGDEEWQRRSGHFSQREERSVMAELLTPQEVKDLQIQHGRWFLPGTPP
jgi:hypothetical protein